MLYYHIIMIDFWNRKRLHEMRKPVFIQVSVKMTSLVPNSRKCGYRFTSHVNGMTSDGQNSVAGILPM
jgi:hypothetical protein